MRNQINLVANIQTKCALAILAKGEKRNGLGNLTKERSTASSNGENRRKAQADV